MQGLDEDGEGDSDNAKDLVSSESDSSSDGEDNEAQGTARHLLLNISCTLPLFFSNGNISRIHAFSLILFIEINKSLDKALSGLIFFC